MALENKKRKTIKDYEQAIIALEKKVDKLEKHVFAKRPSINKVETYNGQKEPEVKKKRTDMTADDRLTSASNACKLLPPNLKVHGRHTPENVSALCGFKVDEHMLDIIYS